MQNTIRNMLFIPRTGTYLYYKTDPEASTRFVEVSDVVDGMVYFNGDDGKGECTLINWQNWLKTDVVEIREYAL